MAENQLPELLIGRLCANTVLRMAWQDPRRSLITPHAQAGRGPPSGLRNFRPFRMISGIRAAHFYLSAWLSRFIVQ